MLPGIRALLIGAAKGKNPFWVQAAQNVSTVDETSTSATFYNNPKSGNLLILCGNSGAPFNAPGGTWVQRNTLTHNTETTVWTKISDGTEKTITLTVSVAARQNIIIFEIPHYTTFDQSSTGSGSTGANIITCGTTGALTSNDELGMVVIGLNSDPNTTAGPFTFDNGFEQVFISQWSDSSLDTEMIIAMKRIQNASGNTVVASCVTTQTIPNFVTDNGLLLTFK